MTSKLRHDRYLVEKVGDHEGPQQTSTSVDNMKPWPQSVDSNFVVVVSDDENEVNAITDDDAEDGAECRMAECGVRSE